MSPAWNPLHGDIPVMTQRPGGAVPNDTGDSATAILGGFSDSLPGSGKSVPSTLAGFVILSALVIAGIHLMGVRTHFTVSAGRG